MVIGLAGSGAATQGIAVSCGAVGIELQLRQEAAAIWSERSGSPVAVVSTLGLRPEHLQLDGSDAPIQGEAAAVEELRGESFLFVDSGGALPLVVKAPGPARRAGGRLGTAGGRLPLRSGGPRRRQRPHRLTTGLFDGALKWSPERQRRE